MCGDIPSRPSAGNRIAVIFPPAALCSSSSSSPSPSPSLSQSSSPKINNPYTLLFQNYEEDCVSASASGHDNRNEKTNTRTRTRTRTRATFKTDDLQTLTALRSCNSVDLRIERYGDLTTTSSRNPSQQRPLHSFSLDTNSKTNDLEFELPERLDLGVSETGIVGRQVTLLCRNVLLGTGVVGWN